MNKKILLGCIGSLAIATGFVVGVTLISRNTKKQVHVNDQIATYEFKVGVGLNPSEHFASEFSFASYYDSRPTYSSNLRFQPDLRNSSSRDNQFWAYQLEISYNNEKSDVEEYKQRQEKPKFILRDKFTKAPIDLLKKDANIYYHSYANDLTGELILNVLIEDKKGDKKILEKSVSDAKRIDSWASKKFIISGFKKANVQSNSDLTKSFIDQNQSLLSTFYVSESSSLRKIFQEQKAKVNDKEVHINNANDLLTNNILPSQEAKNEEIGKQNQQLKNYLIVSTNNQSNKYFEIDWTRPVWLSKTDNENKLQLNYYLKRFVSAGDIKVPWRYEKIDVAQPQSQYVYFNYFNLKQVAEKMVQIIGKPKIDLKQYSQSGDNSLTFTKNSSYNIPNSSNGYFDQLELKMNESVKLSSIDNAKKFTHHELNINNYKLAFVTDKTYKPNNEFNTSNDPYVGKQNQDKITFAYSLKLDPSSSELGISTYYGTLTLDGFKTNTEQ